MEVMRNKESAATKRPDFSTYHKQHYRVMLQTRRKAQVKQQSKTGEEASFSL